MWRNLGAGLAITQVTRAGEAAYSARYPHPFFFGQARSATATAADLDRTETGYYVGWRLIINRDSRWRDIVAGH